MSTYPHQRIAMLDEIDFDAMYDASLPAMEAGTYAWPNGLERREFVRSHLEDILQLPNALCYKVLSGDRIVSASFGSVDQGLYSIGVGLIRPDASGSRAFNYDPAYIASFLEFLRGQGVSQFRLVLPAASRVCDMVKTLYGVTDEDFRPYEITGLPTACVIVHIGIDP